jgi:hypothetical protein
MRARARIDQEESPGGGLGLGFFIDKTLLERSGATLSFENRPFPHSGAIVTVRWPRPVLELNYNQEVRSVARDSNEAAGSATLVTSAAEH